MVFNVCCTRCPRDKKRGYDILNFVEHFAAVHLGGFYMFTCPRCRKNFASSFSANYHMANCWNQNASPSAYSRPFRVNDLQDVDEIKAAMDEAINEAVERLVEEKLEMRSKSEDMIIEKKRRNNNHGPPCPISSRQQERRSRDRRSPPRRSRSRERRDDRRGRDRSRVRKGSSGRDERMDRRRDEPPRPMPLMSLAPPYGYNPMSGCPQMYAPRNPPYLYAYSTAPSYPSYTQNAMPQSLGSGFPSKPILEENKSKLEGPMSVVNMKLFDEKTDTSNTVLEVDGAKGFIQMHFDSKFLSDASPYFKRLFNSPEFINSSDNRLTIARPFVSFVDVMNVLHFKTLPWKMRCKQYFSMGNLHRIYRALKEAQELELPSVTAFLGESMFRQRCFAGEDVCDCTTCIERVVLALHFGIKIPEDLTFPEECCRKWVSDCAIYSCAPEIDMVTEVTRYISGMHK